MGEEFEDFAVSYPRILFTTQRSFDPVVWYTPDFQLAEDHFQLREENNYYNPIAAEKYVTSVDHSKLYQDELQKCSSKSEFNKKDLILKKGLEVLSCHRISAVIAGQYATDDFNQ